ncbi:MAG: thymidine phosphorylase, partial [Kiritimatiellia bacterium]|nr:thymidine phosphorylase [Kiritimatiellia bacterium]
LDLSGLPLPKVDKHSTGGIGDKISLILAPLLACCGVAVPMISGRGLGITGGTLDKLESIPGFRTDLSEREFLAILEKCGFAMAGQTERLAPADRKLYALRDVTGTVPSIPLITASILSKKLAEGVEYLVMDVKCGRGAFMKTRADARALAKSILQVLHAMGRKGIAWITDMNQPLGRAIGNSLEVIESVETLRGRGPDDVLELTLALSAEALVLAGKAVNPDAARTLLRERIADGSAFERFKQLTALQGGDPEALEDYHRLPCARLQTPLTAASSGFIAEVDAEKIGRTCLALGAGRIRTDSTIDPAVGISGLVKIGEKVEKGQILATLHANLESARDAALHWVRDAFVIGASSPAAQPLLLERIENITPKNGTP